MMTAARTLTDDLLDFVESLRADGYNIGAAQFIHVQNLILLLAARGSLPDDPTRLRTLIAPIVCDSPERQADFERRFERWREVRSVSFTEQPVARKEPTHDLLRKDLRRAGNLSTWIRWGVAVLAVAALLVIVVMVNRPVTDLPAPVPVPDSTVVIDPTPQPVTGPAGGLDVSAALWLAAIVALAVLIQQLMQYLSARRFLTSRLTREEPDVARLLVGGVETQVFDRRQMHRTAQNFRLHRRLGPSFVDMEASVLQTVTNPGPFQRVEAQRLVVPEYLILVDRASYRDHQARFWDDQIDWLIGQGVFIHRYYFDSDPRVCYPDERYAPKNARPLTLGELESRYPYRRLLIFSDGSGLLSPFSGRLEGWVDQLEAWPLRALMTPEAPANWSEREDRIEASGMLVYPATEAGLDRLVANPGTAEQWRERVDQTARPLPPSLATRAGRWMDDTPPDPELLEDLVSDLRWYMGGAQGLRWVSACAVYPELHWPLTLRLGRALRDESGQLLLTEERLRLLHRLVWFRHGRMPSWLRSRLIRDLSPGQRREVQRVVDALLESALHDPGDADVLEVALDNPVPALSRRIFSLLGRRAPPNSPLRERVFATFMRDRLAIPLPPVVQQFLSAIGPTGGVLDPPVRRLRNATRMLIAAAAAVWVMLFAVEAIGSQSWAHIVVAGLLYSIGISLVILGEVVRRNRVRAAAGFFITVAMFTAIAEGVSPGIEPIWRRLAELMLAGTGFLILLPAWHQWRDVQTSTITLGTLRIGRRLIVLCLLAAAFPFVSILLLALSSSLAMVAGGLAMAHLLPLSGALIVLGRATRTRGLALTGVLAPIASIAAIVFVAGFVVLASGELASGIIMLVASGGFLGWVGARSARWYRRARPALSRMDEAAAADGAGEQTPASNALRRRARVTLAIGLASWIWAAAGDSGVAGLIGLIGVHGAGTILLIVGFAAASTPLAMYGGMSALAAALTIMIGLGTELNWDVADGVIRTGSLAFMLTVGGLLWYRAWTHWPSAEPGMLAARTDRVARRSILAMGLAMMSYGAGCLLFVGSLSWTVFGWLAPIQFAFYVGGHVPALATALLVTGRIGGAKTAARFGYLGIAMVVAQMLVWSAAVATTEDSLALIMVGVGGAAALISGIFPLRAFIRLRSPRTAKAEPGSRRAWHRARAMLRLSAGANLVFVIAVALTQTIQVTGSADPSTNFNVVVGIALVVGVVAIPVTVAQLFYGFAARCTLAWFHACLSLVAPVSHAAAYLAVVATIESGPTIARVANIGLGVFYALAVIVLGFRWYVATGEGTVTPEEAEPVQPGLGPRPRIGPTAVVAVTLASAAAWAISLVIGLLR